MKGQAVSLNTAVEMIPTVHEDVCSLFQNGHIRQLDFTVHHKGFAWWFLALEIIHCFKNTAWNRDAALELLPRKTLGGLCV